MRQGLPFPVLEKLIMDIPPQIILVTVEIGRHLGAPNVTLNMLIGLEGVLYANTEDGATDTLAFLNFFDEASQNRLCQTVSLSYNTATMWF